MTEKPLIVNCHSLLGIGIRCGALQVIHFSDIWPSLRTKNNGSITGCIV